MDFINLTKKYNKECLVLFINKSHDRKYKFNLKLLVFMAYTNTQRLQVLRIQTIKQCESRKLKENKKEKYCFKPNKIKKKKKPQFSRSPRKCMVLSP